MPKRLNAYHRPTDWDSAVRLLQQAEGRAAPLLLGPRPVALEARGLEQAVDLSLLGLGSITESAEGFIHIGALTPLQDVAESLVLRAQADGIISTAAEMSAHLGLRHVAVLGGALGAGLGPPEVLLALLVVDAQVIVGGRQLRTVPISEWLEAGGAPGGELVREVRIPRPASPRIGAALERVARTPRDQAIVAAAAALDADGNMCRSVRIAVAGANPQPTRLRKAEAVLEGQAVTSAVLGGLVEAVASETDPVVDYRGSADYRRAMAGVLARRAIELAWRRSQSEHRP